MSKGKNENLKQDFLNLFETLSYVVGLVRETIEVAKEVRTAKQVIELRAKRNFLSNEALKDWKRACSYSLEKTKKGVAGIVLSMAMNSIMEIDSRSEKIPWAYYDFVNQNIYYSPAAMKFLKVEEKAAKANIFGLLGYIRRGDIPPIRKSLEEGYGLTHHKVLTSKKYSERPKELMLSTYPFKYADKSVGVAIFLRDPKISFHSRGSHKFAQEIQNVAKVSLEYLTQYKPSWESCSSSPNL